MFSLANADVPEKTSSLKAGRQTAQRTESDKSILSDHDPMKTRAIALLVSIVAICTVIFFLTRPEKQGDDPREIQQKPVVQVQPFRLEYPKTTRVAENEWKPLGPFASLRVGKFTYMSSLSELLKNLEGVKLTQEQIGAMQDVYNVVFEARQNFEASKARISDLPQGARLVEIPSYDAFGKQLRAALSTTFESIVGKDVAAKVDAQISAKIDVENSYWGRYPQLIEADLDSSTNRYKISHVINPNPSDPDGFRQEVDSELPAKQLDVYTPYFPSNTGKQ